MNQRLQTGAERDPRTRCCQWLRLPDAINHPGDRRVWFRHQGRPGLVYIVWEGRGMLRRTVGRLVDVGQGGAMVKVDHHPPAHTRVWLHPQGFGVDQWLECEVVEAGMLENGQRFDRLRFREPCRDSVFEALRGELQVEPPVRAEGRPG